jgi:meiotically up-regulated gene 157 (Mug157) protein
MEECELKSKPRSMTVAVLESLVDDYIDFKHDLPILVVLENTTKALIDATIYGMMLASETWVETRETSKTDEEFDQIEDTTSRLWTNDALVMNLPTDMKPAPSDATDHELRLLRDTFVKLELLS